VAPLRKLKSKQNRIGLVQKQFLNPRTPSPTDADLPPGTTQDFCSDLVLTLPPPPSFFLSLYCISIAIQQQKQHLTQQIRSVLYNMMGHVGLPAILGRITAEHGSDDFGDFKGIIQGMLDSYSHERRMLETVNATLKGDIYRSLRDLHGRRQRGTRPKGESCCLCGNPFSDTAFLLADRHVGIALFACGHAFHGSCISRFRLCPLCHRTDARRPTALPAPDLPENLASMSRAHSQTIVPTPPPAPSPIFFLFAA